MEEEGIIKGRDDAGGHYKKVEMVQKEGIIKRRDDAGGRYKKDR